MSDRAIEWVRGLKIGDPMERRVLEALAARHEGPGASLSVSLVDLGAVIELRASAVYIALMTLAAHGWVSRFKVGPMSSVDLTLHMPELDRPEVVS